jgi:predicted PurR-regulated permease PerM
MTAWELATILVAIAALLVIAALVNLVLKLRTVILDLNEMASKVQSVVDRVSTRLEGQVNEIENEYHRVDGLIDAAEKITARANFLSQLTYGVITKPIIRIGSLLRGTFRAAKVLKGR